MDQKFRTRKYLALRIGALATILLTAACASTPPAPVAQLQAASQAIAAAEGDDAGHSAPGELGEARSKLTAANAAVAAEQMKSAERLALESRAAAELASARTASIKAVAVNTEMRSSNAALVEELNRNAGDTQ